MKIYLGSDHAGLELKTKLIEFLKGLGHEVEDKGPFSYQEDDDYPDFMKPVALAVASEPSSRGILIGKSGQGEAMCANRFKGVRAAVYYGGSIEIVRLSREHNDANVLALGSFFLQSNEPFDAVETWLATPFSGDERHVRRIAKIDAQ